MKPILFIALLLPACLQAQDTTMLRNSLGIFTEWSGSGSNANNASTSTVGLVYKRMNKAYINYTFTAGYTNHISSSPAGVKVISNYTSTTRRQENNINMAFAGVGIEGRRRFYKKVYFICGLEARGGYGSGPTSIITTTESYISPSYPGAEGRIQTVETTTPGADATLLSIAFAPYIGAKLEFKRFTLGTALLNYIRMESTQFGGQSTSTIDFNSSNLYQRLFLSYKF